MKPLRFYRRPITERTVTLTGREAHHLSVVLRLSVGALVELFDGAGAWAEATVTAAHKDRVILAVEKLNLAPAPATGRIVIAVSLAKADRFEWVISKCTELGVDRICPIRFERTVKLVHNERVRQRYEQLALAAAKQSRRLFLPKIDPPQSLPDCLETLRNDYPRGRFILGSLNPHSKPLIELKWFDDDVLAFVGPEGGLTDEELSLLHRYDVQEVRLTDTILRVETAAVVLAALLTAQRHAASNKP
ncbi:RsmE family RNA methyltransferase [Planctomycetota bacterium]